MIRITWKRVGLATTFVVLGGVFALTGPVAGLAGPAAPEPQGARNAVNGCVADETLHQAYLDSARIGRTYGTQRGSSDSQVLWWYKIPLNPRSGLVPGPRATVWPEDDSHEESVTVSGRYVAKVEIEGGHGRRGYPKLGLPEGFSYVKICGEPDGPVSNWVALVIPEDTVKALRQRKVKWNQKREHSPVAKALWYWQATDDHMCLTCGNRWCELQ